MARNRWTRVDRYLGEMLIAPDRALERALEASAAADLPAIAVSPSQGKLLFILARAVGARRILELGTLGGYSGIWLARALPPDGRLVTVDVDPKHAEVARRSFENAGLSDRIEQRLGDARTVLGQLASEGHSPFDFVFIDADKESYPDYLEGALALSRPGTLIVADNVVQDGAVADNRSQDPSVRGIRQFMERLGSSSRATGTALQTVGVKGYDGLAVVLVE